MIKKNFFIILGLPDDFRFADFQKAFDKLNQNLAPSSADISTTKTKNTEPNTKPIERVENIPKNPTAPPANMNLPKTPQHRNKPKEKIVEMDSSESDEFDVEAAIEKNRERKRAKNSFVCNLASAVFGDTEQDY